MSPIDLVEVKAQDYHAARFVPRRFHPYSDFPVEALEVIAALKRQVAEVTAHRDRLRESRKRKKDRKNGD